MPVLLGFIVLALYFFVATNSWLEHKALATDISKALTTDISMVNFKEELIHSTHYTKEELEARGDTLLIPISQFCAKLGCQIKKENYHVWKISRQKSGFFWDEKMAGSAKLINSTHGDYFQLPIPATFQNGRILFPIRMLAELLGYQTIFNKKDKNVRVFELKDQQRKTSPTLSRIISGSNLPFSYFIDAIDYEGEIYLAYDYSHALIAFKKEDYSFRKFEIDKKYGYIREIEQLKSGDIIVSTKLGYVLRFHPKTGEFTPLIGGGGTIITEVNIPHVSQKIKFKSLIYIAANEDGSFYILDEADHKIFHVSADYQTVKLHANISQWTWKIDMTSFNNKPVLFAYKNNKSHAILFKSNNSRINSPCLPKLFEHKRIYGGIPKIDGNWLFLDASSRNVVEAQFNFNTELSKCKILSETHTGDKTAFLNGFGQSFTGKNEYLVIDSDGFNLVAYRGPKDFTLTDKMTRKTKSNEMDCPRITRRKR